MKGGGKIRFCPDCGQKHLWLKCPKIKAQARGYQDGRNYQMSNPNEPRFEDDFDCDDDPQEPPEWSVEETTLYGIAMTKAHAYAQEYDPTSGTVKDKANYHALREGYTAGFLEGFAHRLTHNTGE